MKQEFKLKSNYNWKEFISSEKAFFFNLITALILFVFVKDWLAQPLHPIKLLLVFIWLVFAVLWGIFGIVRHAGALSVLLKEPFGTLVLTLSVIVIEIMMITSVMLTGEESPTLARDTMFAVIMIILNGMVGLTLLLGGWRYREQQLNLQGSISFLSVILLISILGLVLPDYTKSTYEPTLSPFLSVFLVVVSIGIYGMFLTIQAVRHRRYFMEVGDPKVRLRHRGHEDVKYSIRVHFVLLIVYLLPVIFLIKVMAVPINYAITIMDAPDAVGGLLIASLVLAPEAVVAIRAALVNQIQRSTNILLGSALATIGLTIPAVIIVGILTGEKVVLGLDQMDTMLLMLTLLMSILTFGSSRTNVLQGTIHLLLFFVYVALIFD